MHPELERFQVHAADHDPWYGRPKSLHQPDCPYGQQGWAWFKDTGSGNPCCHPRYDISRNPTERLPLGFIQPYKPKPHLEGVAQAEIDAIAGSQHAPDCFNAGQLRTLEDCCIAPDIAPEAMLMHEEGIGAVELDRMTIENDNGFEPYQLTENDNFAQVQYDIPAGWEQALAEWEKNSRLCGPVERYHYAVTSDGNVTLVLDSVKRVGARSPEHTFSLKPDEKRAILLRVLSGHKAQGTIPDPSNLTASTQAVASLREEWGPKWRQVRDGNIRPNPLDLPEIDDPYRYEFHETDPELHTEQPLAYAGPVVIGHDDDNDEWGNQHYVIVVDATGVEHALREAD